MQFDSLSTDPDAELGAALDELAACEDALAEAEDAVRKAKDRLVDVMSNRDEKSTTVAHDGEFVKVTVVRRENVKVEADGLAKAIGKRAFNKLTKVSLDRRKLEAAIADGTLTAETVAPFVSITPGAVYPLVTRGAAYVEDDEAVA